MNSIPEHIEEWMAAALSGGLTKEEQQAFEEHLKLHPEHLKLYEEEKMTAHLLEKTLLSDRPAGDFEERMVRRFRRDLVRKDGRALNLSNFFANFWRIRLVPVMAMLLMAGTLIGLLTPALSGSRNSARKARSSSESVVLVGAAQFQSPPSPPATFASSEDSKAADSFDTIKMSRAEMDKTETKAASTFFRGKNFSEKIVPASEGIARNSRKDDMNETQQRDRKDSSILAEVATAPVESVVTSKLIRNASLEFEIQNFELAVERIRTIASEESG